jgi:hypothetical protein
MVSYANFITDGNVIQLFSSSLTLKQNKLVRLKVGPNGKQDTNLQIYHRFLWQSKHSCITSIAVSCCLYFQNKN